MHGYMQSASSGAARCGRRMWDGAFNSAACRACRAVLCHVLGNQLESVIPLYIIAIKVRKAASFAAQKFSVFCSLFVSSSACLCVIAGDGSSPGVTSFGIRAKGGAEGIDRSEVPPLES